MTSLFYKENFLSQPENKFDYVTVHLFCLSIFTNKLTNLIQFEEGVTVFIEVLNQCAQCHLSPDVYVTTLFENSEGKSYKFKLCKLLSITAVQGRISK